MSSILLSSLHMHVSQAAKTVIVVGPQVKPYKAMDATVRLAEASQYAAAVLPNAKARHTLLHWALQTCLFPILTASLCCTVQ
jgi:CO dehydrogenase/acetyl-CoA synthase epsilon subunit